MKNENYQMMRSWMGSWINTPFSDTIEATVLANEKHIMIGFRNENGTVQTIKWDMADLHVVFDNSQQSTKISNKQESGSHLLIPGREAMLVIQQEQEENNKPWYQKKGSREWGRNLAIFSVVTGILITAYFIIVPWLSEKLAATIEVKTEEQYGDAVFDAMALTAREDKEASLVLNEFFQAMQIKTDYRIHITVVKDEMVNAFALPGGNIVVYTGLLHRLSTYPELAALLSHEFTHVNNRHSTKSVFRHLGSRVFLGLLFGDAGAVTSVLISQADQFKSLKYSRSLEKEADLEGLALLTERKIDPEGFAVLFKQLSESAPASAMPEFLASHPDIQNRINYIREAAGKPEKEENAQLKTIFEKLK